MVILDELVERNCRMLNYDTAHRLNVTSLRNWVETTGALSRDETVYLDAGEDLFCTATQADTFLSRIELLVEKALMCGSHYLGRVSASNL
jgi:hypothetical protein